MLGSGTWAGRLEASRGRKLASSRASSLREGGEGGRGGKRERGWKRKLVPGERVMKVCRRPAHLCLLRSSGSNPKAFS